MGKIKTRKSQNKKTHSQLSNFRNISGKTESIRRKERMEECESEQEGKERQTRKESVTKPHHLPREHYTPHTLVALMNRK